MPSKFKIQISNPCHAAWEGMEPQTNGKFCGSCQKLVVDFTHFTDAALKQWFNQNQVVSCGRFKPEQLDRYIGGKTATFFKIFKPSLIAASIFAFLSIPKFTYAKYVRPLETEYKIQQSQVLDDVKGEYTFIMGRVYDQDGIGLNHINIELKDQNIYAETAADGSFYIKIKKPKNRTIAELIFTSNAFETKKSLFLLGEEKEISIILQHAMQMDFTNKIVVDKLSEQLVGRLGGISIKTTVTRQIVSGVINIFR
ncbi:hypothetical protein SRABI27_00565 [Pedobacter sp. Bi27]|nr:hypothetical protein [Pedobacter sp. Bi126]CAH0152302.1 hypothetical protein SRABI126_00568 [Pedobacter sp. Bi126]CAH0152774.1 hypothetical protein SRABI27_00565 [Pedobacter sp. Bi27]CAH0205978.1 hypothetical protein SRABI36_02112 [Pedobacter sp. Bi36]